MANILNSILWFLILFLFSFNAAAFGAVFYIILYTFEPCIPALSVRYI